jgi:hypothetical protein
MAERSFLIASITSSRSVHEQFPAAQTSSVCSSSARRVYRAQTFALDLEAFEVAFDLRRIRQGRVNGQARMLQGLVRFAVERLANARLAFLAALTSRHQPFLGPAARLPALRQRADRLGGELVGLA